MRRASILYKPCNPRMGNCNYSGCRRLYVDGCSPPQTVKVSPKVNQTLPLFTDLNLVNFYK
ncbi:hypothetical protein [Pseudomonas sp. 25 E 4]|nr:hypothetical protein [Pseudomonas sp. 25 E 4]